MKPPTSEPTAGFGASGTPEAPSSPRSRMLTVGLPAVLIVATLGGTTLLGGSDDDSIRTAEVATPTSSPSSTTIAEDLFTSNGVTVVSTAAPTTRATTTKPTTKPSTTTTSTTSTTTPTTTSTTTTAPTTTLPILPAQPAQPIAPPLDPRSAEDQVRLGGISIPTLGVDAPLLEGIRLTTLDNGPGHWPGTAMPGDVGNVVVAAHRTSHGGPFRNIDQLIAGDQVFFDTDAGRTEYRVTGTQVVDPLDIWIVDPTDTPTATLFACHPPGSVRQRIVVNLELAP